MNCPRCGTDSTVIDSRAQDNGKTVARRRACKCGARWSTIEKRNGEVAMSYLPNWRTTTSGGTQPQQVGQATTTGWGEEPQQVVIATPKGCGPQLGGGGVISDPISLPISSALSDPSSIGSQRFDHEREKQALPGEFLAIWEGCGKVGHRLAAYKAWRKKKPARDLVVAAWQSYMASLPSWRSPQHVSTWLGNDGWLDEYKPNRESNVPEKFRRGRDAMASWLERQEGKP